MSKTYHKYKNSLHHANTLVATCMLNTCTLTSTKKDNSVILKKKISLQYKKFPNSLHFEKQTHIIFCARLDLQHYVNDDKTAE